MRTEGRHERVTDSGTVSRRDFLGGAGTLAGVLATLGSTAGLSLVPLVARAGAEVTSLGLELDVAGTGLVNVGRLQAAEGGDPRIDFQVGRSPERLATVAPLRIVASATMAKAFYDWVASSGGAVAGRDVAVIGYDQNNKAIYRVRVRNARIVEILLDGVAAGSSEPARLALQLVGESSSQEYGTGSAVAVGSAQKLTSNNFHLYIKDLEAATAQTMKIGTLGMRIDPATALSGVKVDNAWTSLPLKFDTGIGAAPALGKWLADTLAGKATERPGLLQLLSQDGTKELVRIDFMSLGISRVSGPLVAGSSVPVECYCRAMKFSFPGLG